MQEQFKYPPSFTNLIIPSLKSTSLWFTVLIKTFHKPDLESLDVKLMFGEKRWFLGIISTNE